VKGEGASFTLRTLSGDKALHLASSAGGGDVTLILLALGTNIAANNQHGLIMLYKAANAGHEGVVQLLLGEPGGHRGPGSGRAAWSSRSRGTKEVIKL
jgi:ankyrin repeat protein